MERLLARTKYVTSSLHSLLPKHSHMVIHISWIASAMICEGNVRIVIMCCRVMVTVYISLLFNVMIPVCHDVYLFLVCYSTVTALLLSQFILLHYVRMYFCAQHHLCTHFSDILPWLWTALFAGRTDSHKTCVCCIWTSHGVLCISWVQHSWIIPWCAL